jgi:hypothetical protein
VAVEVVAEEEITGVIIVVRKLIGVDTVAIKKYIVNLPDYIENNKDYEILYNGVPMKPVPYEEPTDAYKETLEFLKVATKEELAKVYGYTSLDSLFDSESVETIVNDFKTAVDNRKRVYELIDSIGIYALRTIVNELYDKQCYKTSMFKQALKGVGSESD